MASAPRTYQPRVAKQTNGVDLMTLTDPRTGERMMIPLNPDVAEELQQTLGRYMRNFERVSLIAEVNRCKKTTDEAKKAQKAAQQALSAFDAETEAL